MIPGLPIDQKWFDVYLNRTAMVPGKVTMDDWNKVRDILGQPSLRPAARPAAESHPPTTGRRRSSCSRRTPRARPARGRST
jgi:hypothetical protein